MQLFGFQIFDYSKRLLSNLTFGQNNLSFLENDLTELNVRSFPKQKLKHTSNIMLQAN